MSGELARVEQPTPMAMLQIAVQQGADVDKLKAMMEMTFEWERNEARKAYAAAMVAFKADPPRIFKNATVDFTSAKGRTNYKHATLDNVNDLIAAGLQKVGISARWRTEQPEGGQVRVTCILTHVLGHSEETTLHAARDESGNKNSIQAVVSTVTYLERQTLLSATGMAVSNSDDDGRCGGPGMAPEVKQGFRDAMTLITDLEKWSALWGQITEATTACGDVASHEELRSEMAALRKGLK